MRQFLAVDDGGAIVNISSHQAQRAVRGALPYATANAEQQMALLHPLGRVGRATEVADTVVYLLADAASFISGAVLPVDGGRTARGPDPEEA